MGRNSLIRFTLRFSLATAIILPIFFVIFPYYRLALRYTVLMIVRATDMQMPNRVFLTFMPFVSLFALIIATPQKSIRKKAEFLVLSSLSFYLIDVLFAVAQIITQGTPIKYYHMLIFQDLFTLALPIVFWWLFNYKGLLAVDKIELQP